DRSCCGGTREAGASAIPHGVQRAGGVVALRRVRIRTRKTCRPGPAEATCSIVRSVGARAPVRLLHGIADGRSPDPRGAPGDGACGRAVRRLLAAPEAATMARYDDAYDIRHRSVLRGGPHARAKLAGPPLGYGYPSDEDDIARGYYTGGGAYREVTDRPYLAERGLLRRSDFRRLGRRGRDWDRDPRGEVGGPYVGEYRARLERARYGRTLSPP